MLAAINSLHRGQALATSIPSSGPHMLAWIGVYPLDLTRETTREFLRNNGQPTPLSGVRVYRIRRFEVDLSLIQQNVHVSESQLQNRSNYFAFSDESLVSQLKQLDVNIEQLELPYKSNYPI